MSKANDAPPPSGGDQNSGAAPAEESTPSQPAGPPPTVEQPEADAPVAEPETTTASGEDSVGAPAISEEVGKAQAVLSAQSPSDTPALRKRPKSRPINYSLRPAKNIERKMMAEAFARLNSLAPLATFRYVGMGSEFFNDFALFHQALGIREMLSIERDDDRIERCSFNRPYKCIDLRHGSVGEVLPTLPWDQRLIVWLDYTGKLDESILADLQFVVSQALSGSVLVWSVNADPWSGKPEDEGEESVAAGRLPEMRIKKLVESVGRGRVRSELKGSELARWGLAKEYHRILTEEITRTLNDRNGAAEDRDKIAFHQCFHFRYQDGARMLTIGGILLNAEDSQRLGSEAFAHLFFVKTGEEAFEVIPPMLTSREVRFLNRQMPFLGGGVDRPEWLPLEDFESFRQIYRYYPIFAESEL